LSEMDFVELQHFCSKQGIIFLSTPFELRSAELLDRLQVPAFKISSGELTNLPLLSKIAAFGKPIILSTGMSNLSEIREAVDEIYAEGNRKLILLHCTSNYPTRPENVNLLAMETMRRAFSVPIGYSDHTLGIEIAVAAVALGACVIEKHFTLDRNLPGPDHQVSLEPEEFKAMVATVRNTEQALGSGKKEPRFSERKIAKVARKSLVAASNIPGGTKLIAEMLTVKRPGTGISPEYISVVLGKITRRALKRDTVISWGMIR
ncbi:N-acetylneuraminate synthase family protein, partial [Candidatus Gottesmanbacteria bacterium]|nr:N-acetylneuraminate synthase family protein [Candidatus Gottesmanbacteria bacterium]